MRSSNQAFGEPGKTSLAKFALQWAYFNAPSHATHVIDDWLGLTDVGRAQHSTCCDQQ